MSEPLGEAWRTSERFLSTSGDMWEALRLTIALFRELATGIAMDLGFGFAALLDEKMAAYLCSIQDLSRA